MSSPLRQLLDLLTQSVSTLERVCADKNLQVPDLNQPFHPQSEAFRADPVVAEQANTASAAALHLAAILLPPQVSLYQAVGGHFKSAAIRACLESNVTEILREAGAEGLHVNDIAAKNGQDPQKIGRFLRILATNHIYREVKPEVFVNTRISSMLDTMKPVQEILSNPSRKHDGTPGLAALASHHLDETFKASAYAWETLADPKTAKSVDPDASPFTRGMNTTETAWKFFQRPEEAARNHRFGIGMQGIQALQPLDASLDAYDWNILPKGAVVVDVGGGLGQAVLPLARDYRELQIIVQDLPEVVKNGVQWWSEQMPDAIKSGRVRLEAHDFFTPQKEKNAAVFFLKQILHDWSDQYCIKILTELWKVATPETKLITVESLIPFACRDSGNSEGLSIPGSIPREAPAPLLANYGVVNEMGYNADMVMFLLFNSQERTAHHIDQLLRTANWKMTLIRRHNGGDSTFLQSIEAIPIGK